MTATRHPTTTHKAPRGRGYHAYCGKLLRAMLSVDGWEMRETGKLPAVFSEAVFVAKKGARQLGFFFSNQDRRKLTGAFEKIRRRDGSRFNLVGVLVAPTTVAMQRLRSGRNADKFPRALFCSLEELRAAVEAAPATGGKAGPEAGGAQRVQSFEAEVVANTPIGGAQSPHYRLTFRAPQLEEVWPTQFIMMDTAPWPRPLRARSVRRRGGLKGTVDLAPEPFLKRPFGIYRAFHPYFGRDYLKRLSLPQRLATVLHPAYPDRFDMLYKVLPEGIGTSRMTKLKRGQQVHMLGPLGRPFSVPGLRAAGVKEAHIIGGGVGMAPLVLLVESLRYHAFPVKVFLGIAKLKSLRYRDELAGTFREKPKDAYIYIDDLLAIGLDPADIFVSCDSEAPRRFVRGIPKGNLFAGLVTDQYKKFLDAHPEVAERARDGGVMAFACGPNRMMEIACEIARRNNVRMKVLMEKRMACGIGVCLSCVCKVRRADGMEDYARVCTEGPVFEANEIIWNDNDWKYQSATSACAVR